MDITPLPAVIHAMSQQNLKWEDILSELVDNSLDAGASRVDIVLGPGKSVTIIDDGAGCKDIQAMLRMGDHRSHRTTKLGRYGIGLKDAALFLKGVTEIESVHRGMLSRVSVDWDAIQSGDRWIAPDPTVEATDAPHGTRIKFTRFSRGLPNSEVQRENLGFRFSPAILSGRQLRISYRNNVKVCPAHRLPEMSDVVRASFQVEGRGVTVEAGIVRDGVKNKHPGFIFQHAHREIMVSSLGAGPFSTARIAGIVELDASWALTKNKDDISELRDELGAAIFSQCEPMLRRADRQSQELESSALNSKVSELLTDALRHSAVNRREKRDADNRQQTGTVEPKNTGRRRRNASKVSSAEGAIRRAASTGLILDWHDLDERIGKADLNAGRVSLNSEMPILQSMRRNNQVEAIAFIAFGVFVHAANEADEHRQKYLRGIEPVDFIEAWSAVVARMPQPQTPKLRKETA